METPSDEPLLMLMSDRPHRDISLTFIIFFFPFFYVYACVAGEKKLLSRREEPAGEPAGKAKKRGSRGLFQ